MKTVRASKSKKYGPQVGWQLLHDARAAMHCVKQLGQAKTADGPMIMVQVSNDLQIRDPDWDVAALVGRARTDGQCVLKPADTPPSLSELWFWQDKWWLKAVDSIGTPYYGHDRVLGIHYYLFYEVAINNPDELLASLRSKFG